MQLKWRDIPWRVSTRTVIVNLVEACHGMIVVSVSLLEMPLPCSHLKVGLYCVYQNKILVFRFSWLVIASLLLQIWWLKMLVPLNQFRDADDVQRHVCEFKFIWIISIKSTSLFKWILKMVQWLKINSSNDSFQIENDVN